MENSSTPSDGLIEELSYPSGLLNYSVPATNPFFGNSSGFKEEIFALGFRNPWRFSVDQPTGRIWLADVGQNELEEVDIVENGGNYGWNTTEGSSCFNPSSGCDKTGLSDPVAEYDHSVGQSITGGYVYRGSLIPELFGTYLYADFASGILFALKLDGLFSVLVKQVLDTELNISSFGVDQSGEVYLVSYGDGKIYRVSR